MFIECTKIDNPEGVLSDLAGGVSLWSGGALFSLKALIRQKKMGFVCRPFGAWGRWKWRPVVALRFTTGYCMMSLRDWRGGVPNGPTLMPDYFGGMNL